MANYSIKDLERISNRKAHTIRIWEQRYGLLQPARTETNIRYYDDAQLKKLLNVCTLINRGMKISLISKLSQSQIAAEIDHIIAESFQADIHIEALINQLLIAIATYDSPLFDQLFNDAVKRLGMKKTYLNVIHPLLVRTGLMWTKDELLPSQEHFLSNLIRQKLFAVIDQLPYTQEYDQTWVLFLNEEEDHEIGLLFAHYLLRQYGKKVIYLGARVPYSDLRSVVDASKPTHIYTFLVRQFPDKQIEMLLEQLQADFGNCRLLVSGGDTSLRETMTKNGIQNINHVDQLISELNL
ncbi:MAG TPA: MerR family transcriptional regulator [Dyadobacter sp.]|jgi:DNA-binding transcriptional MerR regulator|nr:MerR family transcriptional regulator [Dyadobacter sp.]